MKKLFILIWLGSASLIADAGLLGVTTPFPGWKGLIQRSSEIIVVKCIKPEIEENPVVYPIKAEVEVVDVLKGSTNLNSTCLRHSVTSRLRSGEFYLFFATFQEGGYFSTADYECVRIGGNYGKELAAGKTVDDKVHALIHHRISMIDWEIQQGQKEKKRLEEALH